MSKCWSRKKEDDKIKQILQEDLAKANDFVVQILENKDSNHDKDLQVPTEVYRDKKDEFLANSEEERVQRNSNRGRAFLKGKRKPKRVQIQIKTCVSCEKQFSTIEVGGGKKRVNLVNLFCQVDSISIKGTYPGYDNKKTKKNAF